VTDRTDTGCVVEWYGRRAVVERSGGERAPCKLKKRSLDLVAGDEVRIELRAGDDEWTVTARLPRRNVLCRSDSRGRTESLAANLDQLGVVVAPRPPCDPFIVDRYLAGARFAGIDSLLVVNKHDLTADAGELSFVEPYRALGLRVVSVSARTREGLEALIEQLAGRRSLLAGQSGVGKSSLLNALAGEAVRATGHLSEGSGEGRHTTVSSSILRTPWGEIADSPGVRDYSPPVVPLSEVQHGFVEIAARAHECRFQDCLHLREPQCAVQAAVESGAIDARRYESYRRLLNLMRQLDERRGWGQ
jgi:ribosome biogenesis GTPase / thiamine phosphate phosphatase